MNDTQKTGRIHDLNVTVWVGKHGIDAVTDELHDQLGERQLVKTKFLRASRGGTDTETLADELASAVNADVVQVRGHTAVFER
jgi:RNA-binding protein